MSEKVFLFQGVRIPVEAVPGKRFRVLYRIFDRLHQRLYEMVARAAQEDPTLKRMLEYEKSKIDPALVDVEEKPSGVERPRRKVTLLSDVERDRERTTKTIEKAIARNRRGRARRYAPGESVVEATPADVMYVKSRSSRGD